MKLVWKKKSILFILLSVGLVPEPPCQMAQDDAAETGTPLLATASPLLPWSQSAQLAHYLHSASASSFPDDHQRHGRRQCHTDFSERDITALQRHHAVRTGTELSSGKVRWLVVECMCRRNRVLNHRTGIHIQYVATFLLFVIFCLMINGPLCSSEQIPNTCIFLRDVFT